MEVSADAPGIARDRCEPGHAGEPVDGVESLEVAPDVGQEGRRQHGPETGHAQQDLGGLMLVESFVDLAVELGEVGIDRGDLCRQFRHEG
ncbi:hypothetical protein [Streptomyces sp.]|uniref:hypothetical protein n=1 Tax=Streptomyces sp. TaxID=1931 RepID=UPI0028126FEA|nr:hypothetical protein [Streptomyces sp.]